MNKLHAKLAEKIGWYAKWHNGPNRSLFHWAIFLAIVVSFGIGTAISIQGINSEYINVDAGLATVSKNPPFGKIVGASEEHILVKFRSTTASPKRNEIMARHGLTEKAEIKQIGVKLLSFPSENTPEEVVDRLKTQEKGNIEFAEVDAIVAPSLIPNDPYWMYQWNHPKISAPAAWDITTGTSTVIVAIGDTGVDCTVEDLAGKCLPGWNFWDNNSNTSDVYGHGTKVAGAAVANTNNALGIAAVCWNCKILPLRVSGTDGSASYSTLASAITYAADHGAKVINESYMVSESATVQSAARYMQSKGGVVTISAGNYSTFVATPDVPEILTIGATDPNDVLYSWSNYGNIIDLVAPGCGDTTVRGGGYSTGCGTSFSAPIVAGVAALIYSANPSLTASQVQNILKQSADDLGAAGKDTTFGWGRVNAARAVALASGGTNDTTPPTAPTNLTASAPESNRVNLSWTASTDNVGVAGYTVYRDGSRLADTPGTSYTDSTVSANTTYSYLVRAFDTAGNYSSSSNTATVTTPEPPPVAVAITSYQVKQKTASSATIAWTTNINSTGYVAYGLNSSNLSQSATNGQSGASHSVTLTGLKPSTKYYYKIVAASVDGLSTAESQVSSFRTLKK